MLFFVLKILFHNYHNFQIHVTKISYASYITNLIHYCFITHVLNCTQKQSSSKKKNTCYLSFPTQYCICVRTRLAASLRVSYSTDHLGVRTHEPDTESIGPNTTPKHLNGGGKKEVKREVIVYTSLLYYVLPLRLPSC